MHYEREKLFKIYIKHSIPKIKKIIKIIRRFTMFWYYVIADIFTDVVVHSETSITIFLNYVHLGL